MKGIFTILFLNLFCLMIFAGNIQKTFYFSNHKIEIKGDYQSITFSQTRQSGLVGEPMLPYHPVALMLPPGEQATSVEIIGEDLVKIPGSFQLFPQQAVQPVSIGSDGIFRKKVSVYALNVSYPANPAGHLIQSRLNGYSFALSTFTPVIFNPASGSLSYYKRVTVRIETCPATETSVALITVPSSEGAIKRVRLFAQNPEMIGQYPRKSRMETDYEILIITPEQFQSGFQDLVNWYNGKNRPSVVATIESIGNSMTGQDLQEKIRNYIIQEYQGNGIDQVILGGDIEHVPCRGFYCHVQSGAGYEDGKIPADIYYSALDGTWNSNSNGRWGEPGEEDLLPEISVGRMPFSTEAELVNMVHKSLSYQSNPVPGELSRPFFVSEKLYNDPVSWGSDYLELLVDGSTSNGYSTYGIPSALNTITRLYDSTAFVWNKIQLLEKINAGQSFIHHTGHANALYMMRLCNFDITNESFSMVNGITHNYQLMYTHGCDCGSFDVNDCIAERAITMANWLVAGVFNSRYGWFNQGTNDGPSPHLHREFISALYHPDPDSAITELGSAHTMSKIKAAPWVGLPGEFEPGAQRWVHYDCQVLGDPALKIWTGNPVAAVAAENLYTDIRLNPIPAADQVSLSFKLGVASKCNVSIINAKGIPVLFHSTDLYLQGNHSITLDIGRFPDGLYFCLLETSGGIFARKMIVMH